MNDHTTPCTDMGWTGTLWESKRQDAADMAWKKQIGTTNNPVAIFSLSSSVLSGDTALGASSRRDSADCRARLSHDKVDNIGAWNALEELTTWSAIILLKRSKREEEERKTNKTKDSAVSAMTAFMIYEVWC